MPITGKSKVGVRLLAFATSGFLVFGLPRLFMLETAGGNEINVEWLMAMLILYGVGTWVVDRADSKKNAKQAALTMAAEVALALGIVLMLTVSFHLSIIATQLDGLRASTEEVRSLLIYGVGFVASSVILIWFWTKKGIRARSGQPSA